MAAFSLGKTRFDMAKQSDEWPPINPLSIAASAACPRCGEGRLYAGLLTPAEKCLVCGLDYSFIDSGDGPAVFVILFLGFVVLGMALLLEAALHPPLWLHGVLWLPITALLSVWSLRFAKAVLIALQYRTSARQGTVL